MVAPTPVEPIAAIAGGRGPQSRDWCFTLNNFSDDQFHAFATAVENRLCAYCCFGVESGESGTPHL